MLSHAFPLFLVVLVGLVFPICCAASWASQPPMGWNSWDGYVWSKSANLNESEFRRNALAMVQYLPSDLGWEYAVVDGGWCLASPCNAEPCHYALDNSSRCVPAESLWPSAENGTGFRAISDFVHSLGLKFGLHIVRGISAQAVAQNLPIFGTSYRAQDIAVKSDQCAWSHDWFGVNMSHPGGVAYYNSLIQQYTGWGVDFLKTDCIYGKTDYHLPDIQAIARAINASGHEMLVSLSPGFNASLEEAAQVRGLANMFRISLDLWDCWNSQSNNSHCFLHQTVVDQFRTMSTYYSGRFHSPEQGLNGWNWPDADMLPLGTLFDAESALTLNESQSVLTAWIMWRNPLFFGGRVYELGSQPELQSWLQNAQAMQILHHSGNNTALWYSDENSTMAWSAQDTTTADMFYFAFFNFGPNTVSFRYSLAESPWHVKSCQQVSNVWSGAVVGSSVTALEFQLTTHSSFLLSATGCQ